MNEVRAAQIPECYFMMGEEGLKLHVSLQVRSKNFGATDVNGKHSMSSLNTRTTFMTITKQSETTQNEEIFPS